MVPTQTIRRAGLEGAVDRRRGGLRHVVPLLVHLVVGDVVDRHRSEGAETDVEGEKGELDAGRADRRRAARR